MLSIPHLIIIFIVALVVFGPEKLPELARNFGKVMGEFRRATGDLRSTFEEHLRDLERETDLRRIGSGSHVASAAPPVDGAAVLPDAEPALGTVPAKPPYAGSDYEDSICNISKPDAPGPDDVPGDTPELREPREFHEPHKPETLTEIANDDSSRPA